MDTRILNMNHTVGERELLTDGGLTPLEIIWVRYDLSQRLQGKKQDEQTRVIGANMEANTLHELVEYLDTDPAHIAAAQDGRIGLDTQPKGIWETFAIEKDKAFNRRYYNNPEGKPEWKA